MEDIFNIKKNDIANGTGVRVSLFVSGCTHHCKNCFNKEAWDFCYGKPFEDTTIDYIIDLMDKDYIAGLSILGGEPLELVNQQGLLPLVKKVKEKFPNKTIWCYTGYEFEKDVLNGMYKDFSFTKELLENIDIMVDGQFIEEKKLIDLKFRGSTNQKKIDVRESLKVGKSIYLKFGDEARYIDKEANNKAKIYSYYEFKSKKEEKRKENETLSNDNGGSYKYVGVQENNVIPFNKKEEYIQIEEKISAENIDDLL